MPTTTDTHRWIVYYQYSIPGNQSFELRRCESRAEVNEWFIEFDGDGQDAATAHVYAYGDGDGSWELAREFERIGCPFDYPDYVLERGPRGGIRWQHA